MAVHRLKRSFTAGELSPLMTVRVDLNRYKSGCKRLRNMYNISQGPAVRRGGLKFIYDISSLITDMGTVQSMDIIPFVFSEAQAYAIIVITDDTDKTRLFFGYEDGLIEDPLVPGTPYSIETTKGLIANLFSHTQSGDIVFIAQRNIFPTELARLDHDDWEFREPVFTDQPTDWNVTDGYPGKVTLYEQRSAWASTLTRTNTIWFSESGDLYSFSVSSPLVKSDAITFTLASGQQNKISWLNPANRLLIGTLGDEWSMSGAGYDPLSFSSVVARRQTTQGAQPIHPIMIGASTLFLERLGRTVYQFVYDYNIDSYKTVDLTILAPHLTRDQSIVNWDVAITPNSIIWGVREDGKLLGLTYQAEHQVTGWHLHDTQGFFEAVGCIPSDNDRETESWFLVSRYIDGVDKIYLEKSVPEFKSGDAADAFFVDSGLIYDDTPIQTVTGLDHLEGEIVHILADGAVHAPQTVVSGSISLYKAYSKLAIGLPYTSILEPYPVDLELATGTTLGRVQRASDVTVYLYESLGMKLGYDIDHLEEIPFRVPQDPTGQGVPLFSGIKKIQFPEGYHDDSNIIIVQDQPLPLTVLGTVDMVEVYDK